jgi:lipopolysaccharide/colanic/teichoic acid biosynthesis glycosyltransferase
MWKGPASGWCGLSATAKLVCDVVIASLLLLLLAPVMLLIGLCVVLDSPGAPFYRAARVGRGGRRLYVLKFRKMRRSAAGLPLTLVDDERFTRVGRWLAKSKLDELPQLLNVIAGQMSLVGPRPEDSLFVERHAGAFETILAVRPGITGLSQLAFAAEGSILDPGDPIQHYEDRILPQKLELDTLYVTDWRPLLDVRVLWWTFVSTVLRIPVSVDRSSARLSVRRPSGGRRRAAGQSGHTGRATIPDAQPMDLADAGPRVQPATPD